MKLKEFINDNISEFEEDLPVGLWEKIDAKLPEQKKFNISFNNKILRIAAGIVICVGIGYWFGKSGKSNESQFSEYVSENKSMMVFTHQIKEKQESLQELTQENPELGKAFVSEIGELQTNFEFLEEQLKTNPNHDQIIEAMIQNLKWQLELLEKQTTIAKKFENKSIM